MLSQSYKKLRRLGEEGIKERNGGRINEEWVMNRHEHEGEEESYLE